MAAEQKPVTVASAEDSPELAHFRFREKELIEKGKKLDAHPQTTEHDIAGSKQRQELALRQVRAEIKRLEKK